MKSKILTILSLGSLLVLGACGDDNNDTPTTKAEECGAGISEACLLGTWKVNGPTEVTIIDGFELVGISTSHDFTASPATLRFYLDEKNQKKFEFTWSPLSTSSCKDGITYGDWSIEGNQLSLKTTAGNTCYQTRSTTVLPTLKNTGTNIEMNFGKLFLLAPEMEEEDNVLRQTDYEVFYIGVGVATP